MQSKATIFEFTSYKFEPAKKRITFNYRTIFEGKDPLIFTETIILPKVPNLDTTPKEAVNKLLESLHIILGISYYKFYCATKVTLPYGLSKKEADFWNIIYKNGLGEFFYVNKLEPNISPKFPFVKNVNPVSYNVKKSKRCLVGIGGGKDSIIAGELLKQHGFDITAFHIETNKKSALVDNVIEILNAGDLKIQRFLDWQIHQQHQYNGHIPISAIYAFLGLLSAVLYDYSHVVVGNEHSSNFGNIIYKGIQINHQWSKSYEFERLFQNYIKDVISPDIFYFSLLRSFYEIRIVKMFSIYKKYFPYFSSCNRNFTLKGSKGRLWCRHCAKCVFAFIMLSAFLNKKELIKIFGKNLYENATLLPAFRDVLGFGKMKPFDCVGTFQEAQTALFLAKKNFENSYIVRQLGGKVKYHPEVFQTNKENSIPEQFKFLGMKGALIVGYGKEGQVTKKYLKKYYPKLKIGIADMKQGNNYLDKQKNYDIAIKSPGIKKELVTIPYTTATNIFLSKITGQNMVIGVTGSKGKSTTSSLIYAILKEAGKDVVLLGNIGKPMLEALLYPVKKNTIFVLELSSYQLDDITFSPDIAVVTNLFPEHMDFHSGIENYYSAKKNIIHFQNKENYFVYNPELKKMGEWLKTYHGKAIPFAKNIPLKNSEIPLIGEHNRNNIKAAVSVARILHIPDITIKKAAKKFKGLPHRLEFIGEFKGITFYDDAISTTPESTIMALKSLPNVDTIFLGGEDRGYNFSQLEKTIKKYHIRNVVLFPDSGNKIIKHTKGFNILKTKNMKDAVAFAYKHTKKGGVCLLSCASPSYSLWKNFEEKGEQFKKFVKNQAK